MLLAAAILLAGAVIALAVGIVAMAVHDPTYPAAPIPGVVAAIAAVVLGSFALKQMKETPRA
jgi:hypothetical protein